MLVDIKTLGGSSKVWIYQADRALSRTELDEFTEFLDKSVNSWEAHGAPLKGGYQLLKNRFLVLVVDEGMNAASGCSIDASTRWLKQWGEKKGINFFDRSIFIENEEGELNSYSLNELKSGVEEGRIQEDNFVYTPTVANYAQYLNGWPEKVGQSWMKRYFKAKV